MHLLNMKMVEILKVLEKNEGITFNKLYSKVRGNRNSVKDMVDWLIDKGLVYKVEVDKNELNGFPYRYRNPTKLYLTPKGKGLIEMLKPIFTVYLGEEF